MNQHAQKAAEEVLAATNNNNVSFRGLMHDEKQKVIRTIIQAHAIEPALEAEKNKWIAEGMRRAAATIDVTEPSAASVRKATILAEAEALLKGDKV